MATSSTSLHQSRNAILNKLAPAQFEKLSGYLQPIELELRMVLYEANSRMDYAYFPESGMISIISVMNNGDSIEIGTIGREGMSGQETLLGAESMPYRYFIQVEGHGHRISIADLKEVVAAHSELQGLVRKYARAFLTQTMQNVACNGLHSIPQRCCRWLLMARDRSDSDEIMLTQEFLALMLGVRRASVSEVLRPLQEAGLVTSVRGRITILDRDGVEKGACECYRIMQDQLLSMLN
jgi:CRP-like cAMP-binding protein